MIRITFLLACAFLAASRPAFACSVTPDYRLPTNLELVERAEFILLGIVEPGSGTVGPNGRREGGLTVRAVATLKGAALPQRVPLPFIAIPPDDAFLSNPAELERAHTEAYTGGCIRSRLVEGSMVVLFLRHRDGRLTAMGHPFARESEDVPSPDARWVQAVRLYVEIAAMPEAERRPALLARQASLRARAGDADAQSIADDIDRTLRGPNEPWNTMVRERAQERLEQQRTRDPGQ